MPEIVRIELISRHHDDPLAGYFRINKTQDLIARKYYWLTLYRNIKAYLTGCDVCLAFKSVKYKPHDELRSFPVSIYWWKDLFFDFVTRLPVSTNWKDKPYDSILVIVNRLMKIVYYEPVNITISPHQRFTSNPASLRAKGSNSIFYNQMAIWVQKW